MPIVIDCPCGRRLRAAEQYAGRKVKCPACGGVLEVPGVEPSAAAPPADDTYELAEAPPEPRRPAPPRPAPTAAAASSAPPAATPDAEVQTLHERIARRSLQRDAAAEGTAPLFNVMGIEFTRPRLAVAAVLLLLLVVLPWWFFAYGPGAKAVVLSTTSVTATPLLPSLKMHQAFNLYTGEGDRGLGVQGMASTQPGGAATGPTGDARAFAIGGSDQLIHTRPDPAGGHLLVRVRIAHGLFDAQGFIDRYDSIVRADMFKLEPVSGDGPTLEPTVLYTAVDGGDLELDTGGAETSTYTDLVPAGLKPSSEQIEQRNGGPASGTVRFDAASGATGQFEFSSPYFLSGSPMMQGLTATGRVERPLPGGGGAAVYDYQGGSLHVTWPAGRSWWATPRFTTAQGASGFSKLDVALLFDRPQPGGRYRLKFGTYTVGTIDTADAGDPSVAQSTAATEQPEPPPPPTNVVQQQQQQPTVTGYFQLLAEARHKARGVVAASNMTQVGLALQMYAQQNGGELPETLDELRTLMPEIDQLLTNPRTKETPGFIYRKPAQRLTQLASPAQTPILWEAKGGQIDPAGAVLYADGHIEMP